MMSDDALAFLAEAFGHYSEVELQAFLDATDRDAAPDMPVETGPMASVRLVRGDGPAQASLRRDRPQAA
ncbi:hypothetical protein MZTS_22115 [Methylorubrum zatmanii]|nr:hypothetical protein [Methylorubrum zatmanii]